MEFHIFPLLVDSTAHAERSSSAFSICHHQLYHSNKPKTPYVAVRTQLLISLRLRSMTRFRPQLHNRTINKVFQPIMRIERLRLGNLHLIRPSLPDTLIIRRDRLFQRRSPFLNRLQRLNKTMRRVKRVVSALSAICLSLVKTIRA